MSEIWRLIDSGPCSAAFSMALDEAISRHVREKNQPPTLRFYGWDRPSVSLGRFQKSSDIDLEYCREKNIPVVRRPTGGRAILHGDELTYSFAVRTDTGPFNCGLLESYRLLSEAFLSAFRNAGISAESKERREKGRVLTGSPLCFRTSSYKEILSNNNKLIGSAQRRWKDGLLQQGSIPLSYDRESVRRVFRICSPDIQMAGLNESGNAAEIQVLKRLLSEAFEEIFSVSLQASHPSEEELLLAVELQEQKYFQGSWNLRQ